VAAAPDTAEAVALTLREGGPVRIRGAGTKLGWGRPVEVAGELSTEPLSEIVEHNEGDLTAILQAGVPLAAAQERFAAAGQMLALDPPGAEATIGGVIATGDSGPLRQRYGAPRDLVLGVQLALPDGSVARAGSKVIKNVAGYDLAKLSSGAFGTLGVICEVSVRLHPRPPEVVTALVRGDDAEALAVAARTIAHLPLEPDALDLRWDDDGGAVLVRLAGPSGPSRARAALDAAGDLDGELVEDGEALWAAQRDGQRGACVVRVSTTQSGLPAVLAAARRHGARVVARAALGLAWVTLPKAADDALQAAVRELRAALAPAPCVVLDAPAAVRAALDPWATSSLPRGSDGTGGEAAPLELMRAVKARFDPGRTCNPGLFVGGI
jgi:glycolate oxidase FAD binding subunit